MERVKHATSDVIERDRLAYWTDLVCASFVQLHCTTSQPDDFAASIENVRIGNAQLSAISASSQSVARRRSEIARASDDFFLLSVQTRGVGRIQQDGRVAQLSPGDLALYDTTRPYELQFPSDFGQLVLRLPRDQFASNCRMADRLTAMRIHGDRGVGLLAAKLIDQMSREAATGGSSLPDRLELVVSDLVALALAEQFGAATDCHDARQVLRLEIESFIDANFRLPQLTCELVAERHGISERYLRKVFENEPDSVSGIIWSKRLDAARRTLEDPMARERAISSIGYDVGFKDTGHFSRSFKVRYGLTPRDWRSRSLGPRPDGATERRQ